MMINETPRININLSETGCCSKFNLELWDEEVFIFEDKLFLLAKTVSFFYVPLNMGSMMKRTMKKIEQAKAISDQFLILSTDPSPWKGYHYFAVDKKVDGAEMIEMTGTFLTKVFEGPYKDAGEWINQMKSYVELKGREIKNIYLFYTTCPKCAEKYGKNYVVAFAEV